MTKQLSAFREWGSTVAGGAVIVATFSIISRVFGLVRDRMLASHFGAGQTSDAYYAAFRVPDFVFQTLVLGALASAFIPVFVQAYHRNRDDGFRVANGLATVLFVSMGVLALAMALLAPQLVHLVSPGFVGEQQALTVAMTRVMLLAVIMFAVSNVASGVLQGVRRFVAFSAAPVVYNLGLILGITTFVPLLGPIGLAWGVVAGAFGHLVVQSIAAYRAGWRPSWLWAWRDADVRHVWKLMLPRTFGLAAGQLNEVIITAIASTLAVGSLSQLTWADNLQNVPTNVFGLPLAIASFPVLSLAVASNSSQEFAATVAKNLRRIMFLVVPVAALLIVLRAHVVRVVLGAGNFDWADTYHTAQVLGIFSVALVGTSMVALLARAFYAQQDTRTPRRIIVKHNEHPFGFIKKISPFPFPDVLTRNTGSTEPHLLHQSGISLTGTQDDCLFAPNRIHPVQLGNRTGKAQVLPADLLAANSGDVTHLHIRDSDLVLQEIETVLVDKPRLFDVFNVPTFIG
jgi:putative peptidoglycan lipid II flippase